MKAGEYLRECKREISGPFELSKELLLKLDEILLDKKEQLEEFYNNLSKDNKLNVEEKLLNETFYSKKEYNILFTIDKRNTKKKYENLNDAIKEQESVPTKIYNIDISLIVHDTKIKITYSRQESTLEFKVESKYEEIKNETFSELETLFQPIQPKPFFKFWNKIGPINGILFFIFILSLVLMFINNSISEQKTIKAKSLVENGINEENLYDAIEFLIRDAAEISEPLTVVDNRIEIILYFSIFITIILCIPPRSNIDLGREHFKFKIHQYYMKFLALISPITIIATLIGVFKKDFIIYIFNLIKEFL